MEREAGQGRQKEVSGSSTQLTKKSRRDVQMYLVIEDTGVLWRDVITMAKVTQTDIHVTSCTGDTK